MIAASKPSAEARAAALAEIVERLSARLQAGEPLDAEQVLREYPDYAEELRGLLPTIALMADLPGASTAGATVLDGDGRLGELGDFRLIREVGRGGMGVVYKAEQISLNRRVALKVLPLAATMDPRQLARFRHEAQAAAMLHHSNIVPVYGVGCERGVHYYAMQLIEGRSLAAVIGEQRGDPASSTGPRNSPLRPSGTPNAAPAGATQDYAAPTAPVAALSTQRTGRDKAHYRRVAELVAQAADALEYAHSMGVVHRDIKPANLMLDEAGHLWVTDFGLAKLDTAANLTVSGDLLGTLRYMSPEQALARHGLVDHRTDVYSLSATLYELLTLHPAVGGEDKHEVLRRIAFEESTPLRKIDKAIPAELETITLKALAKNPAERYATAGEFAADLRRWLGDRTIKAKSPTLLQRAGKWARRHAAVVRSAVAALAVSAVALAISTYVVWKKEAKAQASYERALAHLLTARKATDAMLSQVADRLNDVPRMQHVRRDLLQQAKQIYQDFLSEYGDNPALRLEAGVAYRKLAQVEDRLDRRPEADRAYRQSVWVLRALAADSPADRRCQQELVRSCAYLGAFLDTLQKTSKPGEAEQFFREAARVQESLVEGQPADAHEQAELANTYGGLALALVRNGKAPEAESTYRRAIDLFERLPPDEARKFEVRHYYAQTLRNLSEKLAYRPERASEANDLTRQALTLYEGLVAEAPNPEHYRAGLALCYDNLCGRAVGTLAESTALARRAVEIRTQLVADFPLTALNSQFLEPSVVRLFQRLRADKRFDEAEDVVRRAEELWRDLAARHPDQGHLKIYLALCLGHVAEHLEAAGRLADAEVWYRKLPPLWEAIVVGQPDENQARYNLAESNVCLGRVRYYQDRRIEAAESFHVALTLYEKLAAEFPSKDDCQRALASLLADCPDIQFRNGHRAVAAARRATELDPKEGLNWLQLGVAHYRAGDFPAADKALRTMFKLNRNLDYEFPTFPAVFRLFLAMAHWQVGAKDEARARYEEAVKWMDAWKRQDPDLRRYRAEATALLGEAVTPAP